MIYLVVFLTALFSPWLNRLVSKRLSVGVWGLIFSVLTICVTTYLWLISVISIDIIETYMARTQSQFLLYDGGSNRYDIQWNNIYDFFYNSLWAIPQGFIGPTFLECLSRPILFPVFLEGLLYLTTLVYLLYKLLQISLKSRNFRVYILPYIYVCFVIIFISYPWLMFNSGSALRYKQSMHPILIFYPLLIIAYYKAEIIMKSKIIKN